MSVTSVELEDGLDTILENKRATKKEIINKALKFYLNKYDSLETEIKEMEFKISKMQDTLNKYKKFQEEIKKQEPKKPQEELKERDLIKELIDNIIGGWKDPTKQEIHDRLVGLDNEAIELQAKQLQVSDKKLKEAIEKWIKEFEKNKNGG